MKSRLRSRSRLATALTKPFLLFQIAFQFFRAISAAPRMPQRTNGLSIGLPATQASSDQDSKRWFISKKLPWERRHPCRRNPRYFQLTRLSLLAPSLAFLSGLMSLSGPGDQAMTVALASNTVLPLESARLSRP